VIGIILLVILAKYAGKVYQFLDRSGFKTSDKVQG